jgi:hypothetical protein
MSSTDKERPPATAEEQRLTSPSARFAQRKRFLYPAAVVVAAALVGSVAAAMGASVSAVFLALATGMLGWAVWLVAKTARALTDEAPAYEAEAVSGGRRKELTREKQALLKALKELEFDHEMGKVSDKDYNDISTQYRARAVGVMRRLDEAAQDYAKLLEKDLAARRGQATKDTGQANPTAAPDVCATCHTKNDADAEFCKKCGAKIARQAS